MTPRSRTSPEETTRLSGAWGDLVQQGQAPELAGRSVEEAERDKSRKRKLMPTEIRRRARKISPTLSEELVSDLREICGGLGFTNDEGDGIITSAVIEGFLRYAVEAYREGRLEAVEEQVIETALAFRGARWPR
jgi:hypothetical protein